MVFPKNNLPTDSQPWTRDVEKRVENLESSFRSAEVNNVTRDSQTLSQVRRLDAAVTDAAQAAADASAAATEAQNAINGLISLGSTGSLYDINADNITGGTITGTTIQTAGPARVVLSNSNNALQFTNTGGSTVANVFSGAPDGVNYGFYLNSGSSPSVSANNLITLRDNFFNIRAGNLSNFGSVTGSTSGVSITGGGSGTVSITGSSGVNISGATSIVGSLSANTASITGTLSAESLSITGNSDLQGRIISAGTYNAVASSTANVLINTNNYFQRTTSSRRYKSDIQDIDYGMKGLELQPRTWVDKAAYEENGNSTEGLTRITGFIAEEIHELGLTELVQYNDDGLPEAVNYDRMMVTVIPILKQQQSVIEQLTARIEALEGKV